MILITVQYWAALLTSCGSCDVLPVKLTFVLNLYSILNYAFTTFHNKGVHLVDVQVSRFQFRTIHRMHCNRLTWLNGYAWRLTRWCLQMRVDAPSEHVYQLRLDYHFHLGSNSF
jgi:hypothetical protein